MGDPRDKYARIEFRTAVWCALPMAVGFAVAELCAAGPWLWLLALVVAWIGNGMAAYVATRRRGAWEDGFLTTAAAWGLVSVVLLPLVLTGPWAGEKGATALTGPPEWRWEAMIFLNPIIFVVAAILGRRRAAADTRER